MQQAEGLPPPAEVRSKGARLREAYQKVQDAGLDLSKEDVARLLKHIEDRERGSPYEDAGEGQDAEAQSLPYDQEAAAGDEWQRSALDRREQGKKPFALPQTGSQELNYLVKNLRRVNKDTTKQEMLRIMRAVEEVYVPTKPLPRYRREPEPEGGFSGFPSSSMRRTASGKGA